MSSRRVKIVILCEDSQQEAFITRFLKGMGWNTRDFRIEKSPAAGGSAEQWVRETFPEELRTYRQRRQRAASGLVVMIDADKKRVAERIDDFARQCAAENTPFLDDTDAVGIAVPKRNIETWIHYLNGEQVDEDDTTYPKLRRERLCSPAVNSLVRQCRGEGLDDGAPESLKAACREYVNRIKPLL